MTVELTSVIGQLNIAGGTWRGDAPNQVAVREPKSAAVPGAGKGDLFILTEIQGNIPNRQPVERQLGEAVRDHYYLARGSVTASLRRALQAAGDLLYDRNYSVSVEDRIVAGVVALVISGEDAFVAQIGPAACFAVLGDYVRRYPAQSIWLDKKIDPNEGEQETVMGISRIVEPNLHHLRIGPQDVLVLADGRLARRLSLDEVTRAVEGYGVKTVVKNLGKAARVDDGGALVVSIIEQAQPAFGPLKVTAPPQLSRLFPGQSRQPTTEPPARKASVAASPVTEAVAEPEPALAGVQAVPHSVPAAAPVPKTKTPSDWRSLFARKEDPPDRAQVTGAQQAQPDRSRPENTRTAPSSVVPDERAEAQHDLASDRYDVEHHLGAEARTLASMMPKSNFQQDFRPGEPVSQAPPAGKWLRWLAAGPLLLIALLGNSLKAIFNLVLPGVNTHPPRQAGRQANRTQTSPISWSLLRNIAIAIPLLVGLVVGISYLQKDRMREAEYQDLVQTAQSKFEQAQAVDHNAALALFAETESLLVQAEQIKPDQPEIAELRQQMAGEADRLGDVQRLYYMPQLHQYTDPGTNLKEILVQGVEVYVLDHGNNRILHHRMDDLGEALQPDDESLLIAQQGQAVDDITVGPLLGMTWMPAGGNRQTSDLLILSSAGLLEYNPNWGITTEAIAGGESLVFPAAVSSYFGNFYVLDPQANKLLRYLPTADGYSTPPESYFPPELQIDLSNAVDFAIDGAIYILFKDGHISKYLSGQPAGDFNLNGLDRPFNNPVAIFTEPNEEVQHIYVADAGNQRIVQLNKDGSFVRQFKPRVGEAVTFANLQDIFVDEIGARLYILDSNNLYLANIPNE